MFRNQEILARPSSTRMNHGRDIYSHATTMRSLVPPHTEIELASRHQPIPLNQTSCISLSSEPRQTFTRFKSPINPSSQQISVSKTQKIYFTYISPGSLKVERRFIETMTCAPNKPFSNEWEERYFELQKQINSFVHAHEKMAEELCSLKEEIKKNHNGSILEQEESPISIYQEKYETLLKVYEELKVDANRFMDQNIKIQNSLCDAQNDIREEKEIMRKAESEKTYAFDQLKELEFKLREEQLVNTNLNLDKSKLIEENYQLRIEFSSKEKEITDILSRNKKDEEKEKEKVYEKNKSPSKISHEKNEEKLFKIKTDYEKKEKKYEKQLQEKTKEIENFRSYITEIEEKERSSREWREKFEQLYNEKKEEAEAFYKNLQESSILEAEGDKAFYEQRINDLNKILKEKEDKIRKMEHERKKMEEKMSQYGDNYVNERQLAELRKTIDKINHQLLEKGGVIYNELDNKAEPYDNGQIFEQKLIYELKKDNQKLVKLLSKINLDQEIGRPNIVINQNITFNNESGTFLGLRMKGAIADTFFKLDKITKGINADSWVNVKNIGNISLNNSPAKSRRSKDSPRKRKNSEKYSQINENNYIKICSDLEILKSYVFDLSETCEKLMNQMEREERTMNVISRQQTEELNKERKMNIIIPKEEELISFFKSKNEQLDKRVQELLGINNTLKDQLAKRSPQDKLYSEYWENELSKSNQQIEEINNRYNKLLTKLRELETTNQILNEKCSSYSVRNERLEQMVKESEIKIASTVANQRSVELLTEEKSRIERKLELGCHENEELRKKLEECLKSANKKEVEYETLSANYQNLNKIKCELQTHLQSFSSKSTQNATNHSYSLELLRSIFIQIDSLMYEILPDKSNTQIRKEVRVKIEQALASISYLMSTEF